MAFFLFSVEIAAQSRIKLHNFFDGTFARQAQTRRGLP